MKNPLDRSDCFMIHKGLCGSPTKCRQAARCLGRCEQHEQQPKAAIHSIDCGRNWEQERNIDQPEWYRCTCGAATKPHDDKSNEVWRYKFLDRAAFEAFAISEGFVRSATDRQLLDAARQLRDAFRKYEDPGTSDLDREQPFCVYAPLGVWRDLSFLVTSIDNLKDVK